MKAKVRKTKRGTWVKTEDNEDTFEMEDKIGKIIEVKHLPKCKDWYTDSDGFAYHRSWLIFPKK